MINTKHVEPNTTQDVQGVGCVGDYISRQAAIDVCRAPHMRNADCSDFEDDEM